MKRPFAIIGFSSLFFTLILYKLDFKGTIITFLAMTVLFCFLVLFKKLRRDKRVLCALLSLMLFTLSFAGACREYDKAFSYCDANAEISAVVITPPKSTEYSYTYTLKVKSINGKRAHMKMLYVSDTDLAFRQGDCLKGKITFAAPRKNSRISESNLASKIYQTSFRLDDDTLAKTGKANGFYRYIGVMRDYFINTVRAYLPGENGKIAAAMVIGDRSGISEYTVDSFNYSGISHLLVVSGLHLTIWSLGVMKIMNRFSRLRRFTAPAGIFGLLFYMSLTGFSVSVLRAGAMVGGILLGKLFRRGADSLNSIGIALTFILFINPFSAYSTALWLSVLSTTGLLLFSGKTRAFLMNLPFLHSLSRTPVVRGMIETLSVSLPVTAFTLPVFIVKIQILPIAAFIANFFTVGLAPAFMVLAVFGMLCNFLGLVFLADGIYFAVGLAAKIMRFTAEYIGFAGWSTVSVSHRYYKYFLITACAAAVITLIVRRFGKKLYKHAAVFLGVLFILISLYCAYDDLNAPSIDIIAGQNTASVLLNSGGTNLLICGGGEPEDIKSSLNSHNRKTLDAVLVTDGGVWEYARVKSKIPSAKILCRTETLLNGAVENVSSVTVDGAVTVYPSEGGSYTVITCRGKSILLLEPNASENPFENGIKYDIIAVFNDKYEIPTEYSSKILKISDGKIINIRF